MKPASTRTNTQREVHERMHTIKISLNISLQKSKFQVDDKTGSLYMIRPLTASRFEVLIVSILKIMLILLPTMRLLLRGAILVPLLGRGLLQQETSKRA
jgi:hypothetical protein